MRALRKKIVLAALTVVILFLQPTMSYAKEHKLGNSLENQLLGSRTCEYKEHIYMIFNDSIYSMKSDGTELKRVWKAKSTKQHEHHLSSSIIVVDGYLYFVSSESFYLKGGRTRFETNLCRIKTDGTDCEYVKKRLKSPVTPYFMVAVPYFMVADGKIYYTSYDGLEMMDLHSEDKLVELLQLLDDDQIDIDTYFAEYDKWSPKTIVSGNINVLGIDGEKIYYYKEKEMASSYNKKTYYRCNIDGKNREKIVTITSCNSYEMIKEDCLYIANDYDQRIHMINMKTKVHKKFDSSSLATSSMYVRGKYIYSFGYNGISRLDTESGKIIKVKNPSGWLEDDRLWGIHSKGIIYFISGHYHASDGITDISREEVFFGKKNTGEIIKKIAKLHNVKSTYKVYTD